VVVNGYARRWWGYLLHFLVASLLLAGGALIVSCGDSTQGPPIDLGASPAKSPPVPSAESGVDTLVLAVAAVNSPTSSLKAYEDLAHYLGDHLHIAAKVVGSKTYAEINSLVRSGDAALAVVCSGAYVFGNTEFGMELLASPVIAGKQTYQSYLIVPASSSAEKLTDLQGKTFAFTDPLSNSGRLVPLYELSRLSKTPETFFSKYIFTYSHENSIKSVAHELVDAAAVDSLIYDHALVTGEDDVSKTKVIWRSPTFAINPLVVSPRLDPTRKAALKSLLVSMDLDPAGAVILQELGIDRFGEADDASYEPVRKMANAVGGGFVP